jgi:Zn finger protein HypA/HybF involved in hydrogenase expression
MMEVSKKKFNADRRAEEDAEIRENADAAMAVKGWRCLCDACGHERDLADSLKSCSECGGTYRVTQGGGQ